MLKSKIHCLWIPAVLLAMSAVPSFANDIVSATVSATCNSYTGNAVVNNLTNGEEYGINWALTFTPSSGTPTTINFQQTFIAPGDGGPFTLPSFTNPISPALSGSLTLSGTATLVDITFPPDGTSTIAVSFTTPTLSCVPPPPPPGGQGCTPGYWKNHTTKWVTYTPSALVSSVFTNASPYDGDTLAAALALQGGPGVNGAKQILLRAAVSALLNSTAISYPLTTAQVISMTDTALASGDRATILALATTLDTDNNLGCPLN